MTRVMLPHLMLVDPTRDSDVEKDDGHCICLHLAERHMFFSVRVCAHSNIRAPWKKRRWLGVTATSTETCCLLESTLLRDILPSAIPNDLARATDITRWHR